MSRHKYKCDLINREVCDRGCCSTSHYKIYCSCGFVLAKDTINDDNQYWTFKHLEHRVTELENSPV